MDSVLPPRDVARIRQVLARELDTINEYEQLAREAESDHVKAFFLHLAEEEKEHVAEATFLLRTLDARQRIEFEKDFTQAHFGGSVQTAAPLPSVNPVAPMNGKRSPQPDMPRAFIPENLALPSEPHRVLHALPAPPSESAGPFTVGPLKGQKI